MREWGCFALLALLALAVAVWFVGLRHDLTPWVVKP